MYPSVNRYDNVADAQTACDDKGSDCIGVYDAGCDADTTTGLDTFLCNKDSEPFFTSESSCIYKKAWN